MHSHCTEPALKSPCSTYTLESPAKIFTTSVEGFPTEAELLSHP